MKKSSGRFILLLGLGFCSVLLKRTYHQEKKIHRTFYILLWVVVGPKAKDSMGLSVGLILVVY